MCLGLVGCQTKDPSPLEPRDVAALCIPTATHDDYFGGQLNVVGSAAAVAKEPTLVLKRLGLPPLFCGRSDVDEEYRLHESRFFGSADVVRVFRKNSRAWISVASTSGDGGRLGLPKRLDRELKRDEWSHVVDAFERMPLCSRPSKSPMELPTPPTIRVEHYDGPTFVIEGRRNGSYRALLMGSERLSGLLFSLADSAPADREFEDTAWQPLRYRTGWILVGKFDTTTQDWAGFRSQAIQTPGGNIIGRAMPRVGDVLRIWQPAEVIISGYRRYGERDRLLVPVGGAFEEANRTPLTLPAGLRVVVRALNEEALSPEGFQDIYARVEPE
jgi:hypothetical protein